MPDPSIALSDQIEAALQALGSAGSLQIQGLELGLARLLIAHSPPAIPLQLELVERHLAGEAVAEELREARQECWSYIGSMACGCTAADSAAAQAVMACLVDDSSAHDAASLAEQVRRVRRCGVADQHILAVLTPDRAR